MHAMPNGHGSALVKSVRDDQAVCVELRHIRSFLAVAKEGGISAAARRLGMTQPALSRQIKALEDELGLQLLDRGARSFVLTPAAELLWHDGQRVVDEWDGLIERVRSRSLGKPLRIGYSPSLASELLPAAIQRFSQMHPSLRISLHERSSLEMQQQLGSGQLDVVVGVPAATADPVEWVCLREQGWRVIAAEGHALARRNKVERSELMAVRLLMYARDQYPEYWSGLAGYFRTHGGMPQVVGEFDGITSLAAGVRAGLGVAIVAESTGLIRDGAKGMVVWEMDPPPEPIRVSAGVAAKHEPPPHVRAFVEELKMVARAI
jgi:LysR family transcriptional regulator, benzoate and cis,cis-muconate-responsive activator of ben and cat genes